MHDTRSAVGHCGSLLSQHLHIEPAFFNIESLSLLEEGMIKSIEGSKDLLTIAGYKALSGTGVGCVTLLFSVHVFSSNLASFCTFLLAALFLGK